MRLQSGVRKICPQLLDSKNDLISFCESLIIVSGLRKNVKRKIPIYKTQNYSIMFTVGSKMIENVHRTGK